MHFDEHTISHKIEQFLRPLAGFPAGRSASSRVFLHFSLHIRLLAAAVAGLVSLHCNEPCAKEDLDLVVYCFLTGEGGSSEAEWVAPNPCTELQQHQVTPHLYTLFHAGASGDSSPSHAFLRRDIRWLLAPRGPHITLNKWESGVLYTRQPLMWGWYCVNKRPVPSKHGSCWCGAGIMWMRGYPLHTAAADVGLVSWEWEGILYTRQPLMQGLYHVNERVSSTHGSRWCGAGIMWMRGYPLHT